MSRVDFYHLQHRKLEDVLPTLLTKSYALNKNILLKVSTKEKAEQINQFLWTFNDESFLPHGCAKDGYSRLQPIYIGTDEESENVNNAQFLFLTDGAELPIEQLADFERVFYIFDGTDSRQLEKSRNFWKDAKNLNHELHYWQQDTQGRWQQKI